MSRRARHNWVLSSASTTRRQPTKPRPAAGSFPFARQLRIEPLEDRRLLSITVNTLIDEADGSIVDGDISLRDAIAAAADGETIDFSVTGTINLTVGSSNTERHLRINKSLTINGPGANLLTIRAFDPTPETKNGDGSRVISVDDFSYDISTVSIRGLTLTGGDRGITLGGLEGDGGAIKNLENLSIADCTISGNSTARDGGGVFNRGGQLTVAGSTISGNSAAQHGGGVYSAAGLTITGSTISGNSAGSFGGGISAASRNITITGSTISGNEAIRGGGVYARGNLAISDSTINGNSADVGGGLWSLVDETTIVGSTFSDNEAAIRGGGVYNRRGLMIIQFSTITDNEAPAGEGSGVASRGDNPAGGDPARTEIYSSIVAGNVHSDADIVAGGNPSWQSHGYNLIGTGNSLAAFNAAGDQTLVLNPMLAPLADYGGPTMTHALLAGSPAIDAGNPSAIAGIGNVPALDQRGAPRVLDGDGSAGARIDIGALEHVPDVHLVVDTLMDEEDGDYSAGDRSLREAIGLVDGGFGSEGTITFAASLTSGGPASILLALGELLIAADLTINGPGANLLTIDAGDASRIFNIDNGAGAVIDVEIVGLTLIGGNATAGSGGAILNKESLLLSASTVSGNSASNRGGGIYNAGGSVTVTGSTITGNEALFGGGGIGNSNGNLQVTASTISGNRSIGFGVGGGGGIYSMFGFTTVSDSTLSGNMSPQNGGGIFHYGSPLTVINSTLSGNTANNDGGGIYSRDGQLAVRHSTITGNQALAMNSGGFGGAGIMRGGFSGFFTSNLEHTIVAGNLGQSEFFNDDLRGEFTVRYSLIGSRRGETFLNDNGGNLIPNPGSTINPLLGPLANDGGPTMTHALLGGSPAIDRGDPFAFPGVANVPLNDQRGSSFTRVFDGDDVDGARIDMGAFELQAPPGPALPGDYNLDDSVDGADYVMWRKLFGTTGVTPFSGADGDGDGTVDQDDYGVWRTNFAETLTPPATGSSTVLTFVEPASEVVDETVVQPRVTTTTTHVGAQQDAAKEVRLAMLETRSAPRHSVSRPLQRMNIFRTTESSADSLIQLLAIDRVEHSSWQDISVVDNRGSNDDYADDLERDSLFDELLVLTLSDWQQTIQLLRPLAKRDHVENSSRLRDAIGALAEG